MLETCLENWMQVNRRRGGDQHHSRQKKTFPHVLLHDCLQPHVSTIAEVHYSCHNEWCSDGLLRHTRCSRFVTTPAIISPFSSLMPSVSGSSPPARVPTSSKIGPLSLPSPPPSSRPCYYRFPGQDRWLIRARQALRITDCIPELSDKLEFQILKWESDVIAAISGRYYFIKHDFGFWDWAKGSGRCMCCCPSPNIGNSDAGAAQHIEEQKYEEVHRTVGLHKDQWASWKWSDFRRTPCLLEANHWSSSYRFCKFKTIGAPARGRRSSSSPRCNRRTALWRGYRDGVPREFLVGSLVLKQRDEMP